MTQPIDYTEIKNSYLESWQELWDNSQTYPSNILRLLPQIVELPDKTHNKLLAAYILTPSALASILPILIFYGQRGTGKSSMGQFISYVHGIEINTGADTFASLRNTLNERRWTNIRVPSDDPIYPGDRLKTIELNTMLIWDDIDAKMLIEQPNIFRMLKSGYNKATDRISIADVGGKNLSFNCFSPKICSTTTPIWGKAKFAELERRILVIKFAKANQANLLRLENFNWSGFEQLFKQFWSNKKNAELWIKYRKVVSTKFKNNTRNTILLDISATGLICQYWKTVNECLEYWDKYWLWYDQAIAYGDSALCSLLANYIKQHQTDSDAQVGLFPKDKNEIPPMTLKRKINEWQAEGMLEVNPTSKVITETMAYLGWQLVPGKWVKMG